MWLRCGSDPVAVCGWAKICQTSCLLSLSPASSCCRRSDRFLLLFHNIVLLPLTKASMFSLQFVLDVLFCISMFFLLIYAMKDNEDDEDDDDNWIVLSTRLDINVSCL